MENELPRLTGREFAFIRKNAGLSQKKLAILLGYNSSSTINFWEHNENMLPFQIKLLMGIISTDVWNACRAIYAEEEAKRVAHYQARTAYIRKEEEQRIARNQRKREKYQEKKRARSYDSLL